MGEKVAAIIQLFIHLISSSSITHLSPTLFFLFFFFGLCCFYHIFCLSSIFKIMYLFFSVNLFFIAFFHILFYLNEFIRAHSLLLFFYFPCLFCLVITFVSLFLHCCHLFALVLTIFQYLVSKCGSECNVCVYFSFSLWQYFFRHYSLVILICVRVAECFILLFE